MIPVERGPHPDQNRCDRRAVRCTARRPALVLRYQPHRPARQHCVRTACQGTSGVCGYYETWRKSGSQGLGMSVFLHSIVRATLE